ncbi:PROTEIN putative-RELATED [Salix viminalis]|uniref:PROTEIN putative-RELATED n=1 Tax=Salix viminalis TaxID=40686 RepID=A0A9Q0U736_SALVM|nr:PROTEIN putative-RELATED [Salix viminalis]
MPLEMRTLGGTDSLMKAANTATDQGRASVEKKPEKDTDKRKMTYEEKHELSISLQNLPSEKLESVLMFPTLFLMFVVRCDIDIWPSDANDVFGHLFYPCRAV